MKITSKIISLITSICIVLSILMTSGLTASCAEELTKPEVKAWDGTYDTSWYDAQDSELHIFTAEELAGLAYLVNEGQKSFEGQTVYLEADIDLQGSTWTAIGQHSSAGLDLIFKGVFNGNNHSISNLSAKPFYQSPESKYPVYPYSGFFGLCSGTICNTRLTNCTIQEEGGGICDKLRNGRIENCIVDGKINSDGESCGGIVGSLRSGTIKRCYANVSIDSKETRSSINTGAGGICGEILYDSIIEECASSGKINRHSPWYDEKNVYVGGIAGYSYGSNSIKNSYSNCEVIATSTATIQKELIDYKKGIVGGIIALLSEESIIENVYFSGIATTSGKHGGIVGINQKGNTVTNAYYLSSAAAKGIGEGEDNTLAKSGANMKKREFANSLGDTFIYVDGSYPKLAWELEDENTNTETSIVENQVKVGKSIQMIITNYTGKVTWLSKNPELLTIDSDGVATGLKAGKAEVYAVLDSGKALSGTIAVLPKEDSTTTTTSATTTTVTTSTTTKSTTTVSTSTTTKPTTTVFTTTSTGITATTEPDYLLGDINDDGAVSVEDAQLALIEYVSTMSGLDGSFTEKQKLAADVNGDKQISVEDAQTILIYYVKNTLAGEKTSWEQILYPQDDTVLTTTTSDSNIFIDSNGAQNHKLTFTTLKNDDKVNYFASTVFTDQIDYMPDIKAFQAYWLDISQQEDYVFDGDLLEFEVTVDKNIPNGIYPFGVYFADLSNYSANTDENAVYLKNVKYQTGYICVNKDKPTTQAPENNMTLSMDSVSVKPGETVRMRLHIENNPGLVAFAIRMYYDNNAMTITRCGAGSDLNKLAKLTTYLIGE